MTAIRSATARRALVTVAACAGLAPLARAADPYLGVVPDTKGVGRPLVVAAPVATPGATPVVQPVPPVRPVRPVQPVAVVPRRSLLPRLPLDAWYGISLRCSDCSIGRNENDGEVKVEWRFGSAPEILDIEHDSPADKAGVKPGDVLTHVDGHAITSPEGGKRFGAVRPGDKTRWTLRYEGKSRDVTVVAGERPEGDRQSWSAVRDELRAAREALRAQRDKLREMRIDASRLHELDATRAQLDTMEQSLAALEQARQAVAPEALWMDPDEIMLLADPGAGKDPVRIAYKDALRLAHETQPHRLRYQGDIGDSHVEVHGSSAVVVTEEKNGDLVIDTPDASIRVKKKH